MNFIILNGVKSTTIRGLMIQSLPPISKPLMRTQIEEIDGRDGDIITDLGYQAYDKQVKIGLHGDFDIDEVIRYFNSEGKVIFSNEPDKYYFYKIIQKIDFDRLIRFRQAVVTFHIQPFKYSVQKKDADFNYTNRLYMGYTDYTETKNGITASIENGSYKINGVASSDTEFFMPVNAGGGLNCPMGEYVWTVNVDGINPDVCSVRFVQETPLDEDSFGGTFLQLDQSHQSLTDTLTSKTKFRYLYIYIPSGEGCYFEFTSHLLRSASTVSVRNIGNIYSRPRIVLDSGYFSAQIYLNGVQKFNVALANVYIDPEEDEGIPTDEDYPSSSVIIDTNEMECYVVFMHRKFLQNRIVTGDYDDFILNVGDNEITVVGDLGSFSIENASRWI